MIYIDPVKTPLLENVSLSEFIALQLVLITCIFVLVFLFDKILAVIFRLLLQKYFNFDCLRFSFGSICFQLICRRVIIRDLKIKIQESVWIRVDQFEAKFNKWSFQSQILDQKLFFFKFVNTRIYSNPDELILDQVGRELSKIPALEKAILDFENLNVQFYFPPSLDSFCLRLKRLGFVWTGSVNQKYEDAESVRFNLDDTERQLWMKSSQIYIHYCHNFMKHTKTSHPLITCNEAKLKSTLFKSSRDIKIGTESRSASQLVELNCDQIDIDLDQLKSSKFLTHLFVSNPSVLFTFKFMTISFNSVIENQKLFTLKSELFGKFTNNDLISVDLTWARLYFAYNQPAQFESNSVQITVSRHLDQIKVLANFTQTLIIRMANLSSLIRILKFPHNYVTNNIDLVCFINGAVFDLNSPIYCDRISIKVKSQSIDRSRRGLIMIDQLKLVNKRQTHEVLSERVTLEFKNGPIQSNWQVITSPLRFGRFKKIPKPSSTTSLKSDSYSFDSYLYTYVVDEENDSEFDDLVSLDGDETTKNDSEPSHFDLSCLYLSVVQIRGEFLKNLGLIYSRQFEIIIGDLLGTIDAQSFIEIVNLLQEVYAQILAEIETSQILLPSNCQAHNATRMMSSLCHINIVDNASLYNLIISPIHYAVCDFHEMAVLPDFNLNMFVGLGGVVNQLGRRKYTDFVNCGTLSVKYSIMKRIKPRDESRIKYLRESDRQTQRLPFLWDFETKCLCTSQMEFFGQNTSRIYEFGKEFYVKPCLYLSESGPGFGKSLLVGDLPAFYSYRKFFPEFKISKINGIFQVIASLEEPNDLTLTTRKSKFQPFEIHVYEDDLNLFLNELYQGRHESKPNETQTPHMTPPYFSSDFKIYVRYLPIIRNISKCESIDPNKWPWSDDAVRVVYTKSARLCSDLLLERKKTRPTHNRKDSQRKNNSSMSTPETPHYKFSVGQLNPDYKLKPPKQVSVLNDKRLRVEELYVETVFVETVVEDAEQFESTQIQYPDSGDYSNVTVLVFFSLVSIRQVPGSDFIDISKISQPRSDNLFHLKFGSKNEPTEYNTLICINKLAIPHDEQSNQLEVKNFVLCSNAKQSSVTKSVLIHEILVDLVNPPNFESLRNIKMVVQNDQFIEFTFKKIIILCPEAFVIPNFRIDFLYGRRERYIEIRSSLENIKNHFPKAAFKRLFEFLNDFSRLIYAKCTEFSYSFEIQLNRIEIGVNLGAIVVNLNSGECLIQGSNKFLAPKCRFKINSLIHAEFIRAIGGEKIASVDLRVDKKVLDAHFILVIKKNQEKMFLNVSLPNFVEASLESRDEIHIEEILVSIANDIELNYEFLIELKSIRASIDRQFKVECDLVRAIQYGRPSCFKIQNLEHNYQVEFFGFFKTKQLMYSYYPDKLGSNYEWLFFKLIDFEIEYSNRIETNKVEEFLVRFKKDDDINNVETSQTKRLNSHGSFGLWLVSNETSPLVHSHFLLKPLLDHACLQSGVSYSVRPLVKLPSMQILLTYESRSDIDRRIYWRYSLESPSQQKFHINRQLAQELWTRLVVETLCDDRELISLGKSYVLSVLSSENVVKIGGLESWKINKDEKLTSSDFYFLDVDKIGVILRERNLMFSFFSTLSSILGLLD